MHNLNISDIYDITKFSQHCITVCIANNIFRYVVILDIMNDTWNISMIPRIGARDILAHFSYDLSDWLSCRADVNDNHALLNSLCIAQYRRLKH